MNKNTFIESGKEHFHFILSKGYRVKLRLAKALLNITMSEFVEQAIDKHLEKELGKNGKEKVGKED
ncbi:MAG: hypothetical protein EHM49_04945 [Deltaproteobacteria bacterium]|nr:MAG: hypothetical protein EHM49_04945 [Deltaproteobacteria bacterium]